MPESPLDELLECADEAEAGAALRVLLRVLSLLEVLVQLGCVHEALQDLLRGRGRGRGRGDSRVGAAALVFGQLGQG